MNDIEAFIPEALAVVDCWELEGPQFEQAVNEQARLMAGLPLNPTDDEAELNFSHR